MASPSRTIYAILGFLTVKPMSGYDIKKAVEVSIANFWKESYGQIYPMLKRLAKEGLVEKTDTEQGGSQVDRQTNRHQIEAFRQRTQEELERYRTIRAVLTTERSGHRDLPYWLMTLSFGERDHEAHLEWCDEALRLLDQSASTKNDAEATLTGLPPMISG